MKAKNWILLLILFTVVESCISGRSKAQISALIAEIRSTYAPDARVAIFHVDVMQNAQGQMVLTGETNLPGARKDLLDSLARQQISVVDSLHLLPAAQLGNRVWALITLSVVPLRKEPAYSSEMVSQTLLGTPVRVWKEKDGWYLVQTPDFYLGWVQAVGLSLRTAEAMKQWRKATNRYVFVSREGSLYSRASEKSSPASDLVLGNILDVSGLTDGFLKVQLPDRREGYAKSSECIPLKKWEEQRPDIDKVIATARSLFGRPYLWGGTSVKGVDCSGFVKTAYLSNGILLARDASQQVHSGQKIDLSDLHNLQPGDLLFFGKQKGRITHVGLYVGKGYYLHSSGRVQENSLFPNDSLYNATRLEQLQSACRIMSSLGSPQIVPLKDHPWYN